MSDFIPPLISSSPPPMPDFDDDEEEEEEDDDVEFGMGISSSIGEDLDFPVPVDVDDEKKEKTMEIESTRLEISGTTNNWKCEEQDSTSQDSGLCMASQSSEGMSPLPQSDDDERCNQDIVNNTINMKHSSTVMFNPEDSSSSDNNCTIAYNNDGTHEDEKTDGVLPTDTGQNDSNTVSINSEIFIGEGDDKSNFNDGSDSDSDFVWGTNTNNDDLFQNFSLKISTGSDNDSAKIISNIPDNVEKTEVNNSISDCNTDSFSKTVFSEENSVSKDSQSAVSSSVQINDTSASVYEVVDSLDNNLCDNSNSILPCDAENDDFDDDFGNFTSVTIPNCDSVIHSNNENISKIPKNDDCFNDNILNNQQNDDSSSIKNNESDLEFKLSSLENDVSVVNESAISEINHDASEINNEHSELKQSSDDDNSGKVNIADDVNNDDEDDFDDFSAFTQSSDLPATSFQQSPQQEVISKSHQSSLNSVSCEKNLEEVFPKSDDEIHSDLPPSNLEAGPVWKHLCPLENSPALTFQWSNSQAHNKLLAALSIDSRNILFGPHWNTNIPRFAANLGTNPLQPIKAIETQSGTSASPIPPTSDEAAIVPDAHFDWVGSGLTNPLDCVTDKTSTVIDQLNASSASSSAVDNLNILSDEAESIMSLLPDLNFMKKTYIEILISKG